MMTMVWIASFCVLGIGFGIILLDVIFLALVRADRLSRNPVLASASLITWIILGFPVLWVIMGRAPSHSPFAIPKQLKIVALLLYCTGACAYLQMRSILSRGYSLRILVDLLKLGGQADLETIKSAYGGGMGVSGLLLKRLRTLADFQMLYLQGDQVGPLTSAGKIFALAGHQLRGILRLDRVG